MKKFSLEIDVVSTYCNQCKYVDEDAFKCEHPSGGFPLLRPVLGNWFTIPDECPLPNYTEQIQSILDMAISFGKKDKL